jgi:hypothetical protein
MGHELNTKAYSLFVQIEVGLREFFISLIKEYGIQKWMHNFLGNVQRDSIGEIVKRINLASTSKMNPDLEDLFIFKLLRAKKEKENYLKSSALCHPFYYLNWTDLEALIKMKPNAEIINQSIGGNSRTLIIEILSALSLLRNDIAHSRFISETDYKIIKTGYEQIVNLIPNFHDFSNSQTKEENLSDIVNSIVERIDLVISDKMLSIEQSESLSLELGKAISSFWLNSLNANLVGHLIEFKKEFELYCRFRKMPGGIYNIIKWKEKNQNLILNLQKEFQNGKI